VTDPRQRIHELSAGEKAALFRLLSQKKKEQGGGPQRIERQERTEGPHPLSFAQERLWFVEQLFPGTPTYNIPGVLHLAGTLDLALLFAVVDEIERRHGALRTVFAEEGGRPVQRVPPPRPHLRPLIDLAGLPEAERARESERILAEEAVLPFDLASGPPLRVRLVRLGPREHVGLFTMHHIVSDGWSTGVFIREMAALYGAFAAGRPSPLPELPLQYIDYAHWQREQLQGEALDTGLAFWRRVLAGVSVLELPTDRPRPAVRRGRGGTAAAKLPADLTERLLALAQEVDKSTLFMGLLAVVQTLLHRLTGQDDVPLGSPVANRTRAEISGLIGFFVNTVVLRGDLSGDPSFREMLRRARKTALAAFQHQEVPFEKIVEALQPERFLSHTPLFQVMFTLRNLVTETIELPGLALEPIMTSSATAKFDLTVTLTELTGGLRIGLEYDRDLFDAATMERLLRHFETLLAGAVRTPDEPVSALPLLTAAECQQLLIEWNRTAAPYPRDETVHALFFEQAARTPEAVALLTAERSWTYAELADAARGLSSRLRGMGVGPEVAVAVLAERSADRIVSFLGVLAAGGFFVPLDPTHPPERREALMARTGARVAVVQERLAPLVPEGLETVSPGRHPEGEFRAGRIWEGERSTRPDPSARPSLQDDSQTLAYVMFTSGSTGEPKGVAVPHRGIVRLVRGSRFADFGPGEVWAQLAPASFDASTLEIWGPLLNGGTLAVLPPEPPSLSALADLLARFGVTSLWLTAGLFHQMVEGQLQGLAPLKRLLAGGDVLSPAHVRQVLAELPGLIVVNGYGPTENTTFTCCWEMASPGALGDTVPIGRPIANTRVYVVDAGLRPVPVGVWGELCAGGDGLARGYFGRPDLTAERFVPDPFAGQRSERGARMYRTGDLVRWRQEGEEGRLEFLGRNDRQVKIRGFRIEPGEIEAVLAAHSDVSAAAVVAQTIAPKTGTGDRRLVAYAVPRPGAIPDPAALRAWLGASLPEPMVPAFVIVLDRLPLTANGKVDRRELERRPVAGSERGEGDLVAPRDEVEKKLAGIWRSLLDVEQVGVHDNFFGLGGHSLLAARMMAAVRDAYGIEVPLRVLFERPTLEELAIAVTEARLAHATETAGGSSVEDLLAELEGLSDDEAAQRLADYDTRPGGGVS
jgi:amino acid adenylation domain-containing protein